MEIENEQQTSPFEDNDFIDLILERDPRLRRVKPVEFRFEVVHGRVKVVEEFVSQDWIVDNVPLSPSVLERVAVPFSREIEPLDNSAFSWCWLLGPSLPLGARIRFLQSLDSLRRQDRGQSNCSQ